MASFRHSWNQVWHSPLSNCISLSIFQKICRLKRDQSKIKINWFWFNRGNNTLATFSFLVFFELPDTNEFYVLNSKRNSNCNKLKKLTIFEPCQTDERCYKMLITPHPPAPSITKSIWQCKALVQLGAIFFFFFGQNVPWVCLFKFSFQLLW